MTHVDASCSATKYLVYTVELMRFCFAAFFNSNRACPIRLFPRSDMPAKVLKHPFFSGEFP